MTLRTRLAQVAILAASLAGPAAALAQDGDADLIPIADFVSEEQFGTARLSPDGRHLALTVQVRGKDNLVVLERESMRVLKVNQLPGDQSVGQFWWSGPERLVFTGLTKFGSFAAPLGTGEFYAVNVDGTQARNFVGRSVGQGRATERSKQLDGNQSVSMLDPTPDDDRHILMTLTTFGREEGHPAQVVEVDTFTGARRVLLRGPQGGCGFALGNDGSVRFANCGMPDRSSRVYIREGEGEDYSWRLINDSATGAERLSVFAEAPDGRYYASVDNQAEPGTVGLFNPADGSFEEVWSNPIVDPLAFIETFDGQGLIGVIAMPGAAQVSIIDPEHPDTAIYTAMADAFPGQLVNVANATADGQLVMFSVTSPTNPGELYLFDRATGRASFLMKRRSSLDGRALASVRPIEFQASDGMTIRGYLTVPAGRDLANLPLIVNPHGGPHGPRDMWGYNRDTQVLASRGYLVLQVNFRGSGGYGEAFQEAGYNEWGGRIMDDINEGARYVIDQGWADGERVCIYGGSFGGYSSMMAPIRDPDLYKCSIPVVGMSDLAMMYVHGDIPQRRSGVAYLEEVIGRDPARLAEFSPLQRVDEFNIPVFLIHGRLDQRVPIIQSEVFRDALEARGREVEWLVKNNEGHGFYGPDNLEEQYTRMFAFLARHIGPGTTPRVTVGDGEQVTRAD